MHGQQNVRNNCKGYHKIVHVFAKAVRICVQITVGVRMAGL